MSSLTNKEAQNWAIFSHLGGLIGSLIHAIPFGGIAGAAVVWLLKRNESEVVDRNGREALNFQISMSLWFALAMWSGIAFAVPVLAALHLAFPVVAAIAASKGESYRYPLTVRFIQSGKCARRESNPRLTG